jgi:hypothetical protein
MISHRFVLDRSIVPEVHVEDSWYKHGQHEQFTQKKSVS